MWGLDNQIFGKKGKDGRKVCYCNQKGGSSENYLAKCWILGNWENSEEVYYDTSYRRRFGLGACSKMIDYSKYNQLSSSPM